MSSYSGKLEKGLKVQYKKKLKTVEDWYFISDDGDADFKTLTESPQKHTLPNTTVVSNSILVQSLIVHEALNVSKMRWRAIVYDFLSQIRVFLATGDLQYQVTMYKIGRAWPGFQLCELSINKDGA